MESFGYLFVGVGLAVVIWLLVQEYRLWIAERRARQIEADYAARVLALARLGRCERDPKGRFVRHACH